ncbi:peptidylprolyl isomerase [Pseudoflavonifractor phocaeensis]|uniref:peptidylprolyl isomerase n=1 Tax=Pseudoflavonifractor phocaeensis TaxID=1870988 RepID=UPI00195E638B|nr:peptidylprolyl isomerase [Pseudoflavonifractor phocaeensis]MBM6939496.1 peptidylprolyl isomerase [Pseudoflavonifractor phocaeensis]
MSASREKKQRQNDPAGGLTQKQIQERKEEAIRKRNHIIYGIIGAVVVVLVAALLVWDSGFFQGRSTAITVNGRSFTPAEVAYYYYSNRNMYANYGLIDSTQSDKETIYDEESGQTYYDFFLDSAKSSLELIAAELDGASAEGVTLSEESRQNVEDTIQQVKDEASTYGYPYESYLKAAYGQYMTPSAFKSCLENAALASQYATEYQDSLTYDEAALDEYYQSNKDSLDTFVYRTLYFDGAAATVTDEDGNTVEATEEETQAAMDAAKAKADAMLAELEAGGDFDTLAQAAVDAAGEGVMSYNGEMTTIGSSLSGSSAAGSAAATWLKGDARTAGEYGVVSSDSGYYVVQFVERYLDETPTVDVRHILIKAETTDEDAEDESGNAIPSDEAMTAAQEEAQKLLDEFNAGDKTEDSFAALAEANSDDPGSSSNGGLYTNVRKGAMVDSFDAWIFDESRQPGDTGLVENTYSGQQGWHVMYFVGQNVPYWQYTATNSLKSTDMTEWQTQLVEGYEAVEADGLQYLTVS